LLLEEILLQDKVKENFFRSLRKKIYRNNFSVSFLNLFSNPAAGMHFWDFQENFKNPITMKKILIIIPFLMMSTVFAQDAKTNMSETKMKSDKDKIDQTLNPLDGKAYKVTFTMAGETDKKMSNMHSKTKKDNKKNASNEVGDENHDQKMSDNQTVSSEAGPLAHKHAVLRFENGMVQSSVLNKQNVSGCSYHVTATGSNQLYSFTSNCTMSTGMNSSENKSSANSSSDVNKNMNNPAGNSVQSSKNDNSTGTPTEDRMPEGKNSTEPRDNTSAPNSGSTTITGSSTTVNTPGTQVQQGNQQNSAMGSGLQSSSSVTASLTGLIDGNTINGTLTCWSADGKMTKYSFTGTKASKSEINSESETGMK
jgi:hypothetical protein